MQEAQEMVRRAIFCQAVNYFQAAIVKIIYPIGEGVVVGKIRESGG
jgi:hypothetical protein